MTKFAFLFYDQIPSLVTRLFPLTTRFVDHFFAKDSGLFLSWPEGLPLPIVATP